MRRYALLVLLSVLMAFNEGHAQITVDEFGVPQLGSNRYTHSIYRMNINDYAGIVWKGSNFGMALDGTHTKYLNMGGLLSTRFRNLQSNVYNDIQVKSIILVPSSTSTNSALTNGLETINGLRPCITTSSEGIKHYSMEEGSVDEFLSEVLTHDENGDTFIDGSALVPLLVSAVQSLKRQVDEQSDMIGKLKSSYSDGTRSRHLNDMGHPKTNQESTFSVSSHTVRDRLEITYQLGPAVKNAYMRISGLNGACIGNYSLTERDKGQLPIECSDWTTGYYLCACVVDGIVIGVKKIYKE